MRILHIHVKGVYWEHVRQGIKKEEYREFKPYWSKRLNKEYDLIHYYLGYTKKKMIFKYDGVTLTKVIHKEFGDKPTAVYAISLRKPVYPYKGVL